MTRDFTLATWANREKSSRFLSVIPIISVGLVDNNIDFFAVKTLLQIKYHILGIIKLFSYKQRIVITI